MIMFLYLFINDRVNKQKKQKQKNNLLLTLKTQLSAISKEKVLRK